MEKTVIKNFDKLINAKNIVLETDSATFPKKGITLDNHLKKIKEIDINRLNIITVWNSAADVTYPSNGENELIFNSSEKVGEKLLLENNKIKINGNLKKIKVSAIVTFVWNSPASVDSNIYITKNGEKILRTVANKPDASRSINEIIPPNLIDVQDGDLIGVSINTGVANSKVYTNLKSTSLTVEAIY